MSERKTLPTQGNVRTMNIDSILFTNINHSDYMQKTLEKINSIADIIDIIINDVHYISPYIQKTSSSPSTAYCVLLRLFRLNPTVDDIKMMSRHSNKYVRSITVLFIRYCIRFDMLLNYFKPFVDDRAIVNISIHGEKSIQIKYLVRDLINEPKFDGSILPRIPQQYLLSLKDFFVDGKNEESNPTEDDFLSFRDLTKMVRKDTFIEQRSTSSTTHHRSRSNSRERRPRYDRSRSNSRERSRNYNRRKYDSGRS